MCHTINAQGDSVAVNYGIHSFECREVQSVKEGIVYNAPEGVVKCSRAKFVKLRNRIFSNPNYLTNPAYYIKPAELESVTVIKGTMMLGHVIINMKPAKFQPLDFAASCYARFYS